MLFKNCNYLTNLRLNSKIDFKIKSLKKVKLSLNILI